MLLSAVFLTFSNREDHARTLEYYKKIWLDYKASYERFPLAKVLKEKKTSRDHSEVTLSEIKIKHQATKERIDNLMKGKGSILRKGKVIGGFTPLVCTMLETEGILC